MIVCSRKNHRPAGRTDRIRAEAIIKPHALFSNTINVGCLIDPAIITTHSVRRMIIGHNKDNMRAESGHT
jgi:hypothetical protein